GWQRRPELLEVTSQEVRRPRDRAPDVAAGGAFQGRESLEAERGAQGPRIGVGRVEAGPEPEGPAEGLHLRTANVDQGKNTDPPHPRAGGPAPSSVARGC